MKDPAVLEICVCETFVVNTPFESIKYDIPFIFSTPKVSTFISSYFSSPSFLARGPTTSHLVISNSSAFSS